MLVRRTWSRFRENNDLSSLGDESNATLYASPTISCLESNFSIHVPVGKPKTHLPTGRVR